MKRRELVSLAMVILGVTLILQGISRLGSLASQLLVSQRFFTGVEGAGQLVEALRHLVPYLVLPLLFAIVPGVLAIWYRERIASLVSARDEENEETNEGPNAVGRGMGPEDALRVGLIIVGVYALYTGVVDLVSGGMNLVLAPFMNMAEGRFWLRVGVVPLVTGLVKCAAGFVLAFRTSRVVSLIGGTEEKGGGA